MTYLNLDTYAAAAELAVRRLFPDLLQERYRQVAKFGKQRHAHVRTDRSWVGRQQRSDEYRALCDEAARAGTVTWEDILLEEVYEAIAERDVVKRREELIQVMMVCAAEIEQLDERLRNAPCVSNWAPDSTETTTPDVRLA